MYRADAAAFIPAGTVIGAVGATGLGWGPRCFDSARFDATHRPDFTGIDYPTWDEPHLHFVVFGTRDPVTRHGELWDPFGLYLPAGPHYPEDPGTWHLASSHAIHRPLWLPPTDGW
jgi:hypothetical protein